MDDLFYAYSAIATREQLHLLQEHTEKIIIQTGENILDGNFAIRPYKYGKKQGCDYCIYDNICRFSTQSDAEYNTLSKISNAELWQNLQEENQ